MNNTTYIPSEPVAAASTTSHKSFQQLFDDLRRRVSFDLIVLVSTMPRGGLQILQPQNISEDFFKVYTREFSQEDRLSWQAIIQQKALSDTQIELPHEYRSHFLQSFKFQHVAAAPMEAPLLRGFAGVLQIYRSAKHGPFTPADLYELSQLASQIDQAAAQRRRPLLQALTHDISAHNVNARQFIFDVSAQQLLPQSNLNELDSQLLERLRNQVQILLKSIEEEPEDRSLRMSLPDSVGQRWNFRAVATSRYPALSQGPVIFFNLLPEYSEWLTFDTADFAADTEMSRMVPALRFLHDNFSQGPTLVETARLVQLSPFHFHRRFTELFGLTPKHYLLDVQVATAKRDLASRKKKLVDIARECGFAHQSHFTSRFKQIVGLTPTRWRRTIAST
ncbi:MAG: helix-turn-helix transcriptional regulator [Phycisphaerales bacterium]|nr:helix-turn-helix transcriptional regulator [Phycisphaerales bacterium]